MNYKSCCDINIPCGSNLNINLDHYQVKECESACCNIKIIAWRNSKRKYKIIAFLINSFIVSFMSISIRYHIFVNGKRPSNPYSVSTRIFGLILFMFREDRWTDDSVFKFIDCYNMGKGSNYRSSNCDFRLKYFLMIFSITF